MPAALPSYESGPRQAREVIDVAIRENRSWELICLGLIATFVVVGVGVVVVGTVQGNGLVAAAGSAAAALFWPALKHAVRIRETNLLIRLLEVPLSTARTAREASAAIILVFRSRFQPGGGDATH